MSYSAIKLCSYRTSIISVYQLMTILIELCVLQTNRTTASYTKAHTPSNQIFSSWPANALSKNRKKIDQTLHLQVLHTYLSKGKERSGAQWWKHGEYFGKVSVILQENYKHLFGTVGREQRHRQGRC